MTQSFAPLSLVLLIVGAGFAASAQAAHYQIDTEHSAVNFKIRHLVSKTGGKFSKFSGTIDYDAKDVKDAKADISIDVASIDTGVVKRDEHLRSEEIFNAKKFPQMTFKSKKLTDVTATGFKLEGDLTLHGVTKPVVLVAEIGGEGKDPWGNQKVGFNATTKLNRRDFGIAWNKALETGGMLVGDDVEISIDIEANAVKADAGKKK